MNIYFIKENDKPIVLDKFINIVKTENPNIQIPNITEKMKDKKIENIIEKLKLKTQYKNTNKYILSKQLQQKAKFMKIFEQSGLEYFDGKWLFPYLTKEIIEYILKQKKKRKSEINCAILTNEVTQVVEEDIYRLALEMKSLTIITNHMEKFKKIEVKIYEEYGITINIANNKRKSLRNADIILNYDFVQEEINRYNLKENAILVNMQENVKVKRKRFNGLVINDYNISINKEKIEEYKEKWNKYPITQLVEAKLYSKDFYKNIRVKIEDMEVEIKNLIGNNGIVKIM